MCSELKKHGTILFLKFVVETSTNTYWQVILINCKGRIKSEIFSNILLKPLFSANVKKDHIIIDF